MHPQITIPLPVSNCKNICLYIYDLHINVNVCVYKHILNTNKNIIQTPASQTEQEPQITEKIIKG